MHHLLERQLREHLTLAGTGDLPPGVEGLLTAVERVYRQGDELQVVIEQRTLELELVNRRLTAAEEQGRFEAVHDKLTGLANRTLLGERLSYGLARIKRDPDYTFALLYIDLDHFKVINDSLGHAMGDKLLVEIGRRLSACARKIDVIARVASDHVARIGGDEFVLLLEDLRSPLDAMRVAERIHAALGEPFSIDGHELVAFGSIGIATGDARYARAEEILRDADTALYRAKEAGKGCTRMFDPQMHQQAVARWSTETDLRRAIDRNELVLYYQPIMTPAGELAGLEALVRWRHPTRGLVPPDAFIPIAEETGLIMPLGHHVMATACAQLRLWQQEMDGLEALAVGVNVSHKQFALPTFADDVARILEATGLSPRCLRIEITESTAMKNAAQTIETVARLRRMGVLIYMDDFGTGFSSLSLLHRMPIDALKIDRAFTLTMEHDQVSRSIVDAIAALAHAMGLRVIAEGVETPEQAATLARVGCEYLQGYHCGRPMPVPEAARFIATHSRSKAFAGPPAGVRPDRGA